VRRVRVAPILVVLAAAGLARADSSPPSTSAPANSCRAVTPEATAEIARLLQAAAEHATRSEVCVDGDGSVTTIALASACAGASEAASLRVSVRYKVTVKPERGGECSPYPECAKAPPPRTSDESAELRFVRGKTGARLVVPSALAGVALATPIDRDHSRGCYGKSAAFVARTVPL
jgi:hypothetical protein